MEDLVMYVLMLIFAISAVDGVGFPAATLVIDSDQNVVVYPLLADCTKAASVWKSKAANPAGVTVRYTRCVKIN